jgi:heme/copper-type cytochrome/quinol oxidase subunit 3
MYITLEAWRYRLGPAKRTLVEVTAIYWHFMDALWIYILLLMWWWR